jgi:hypothetical protein
MMPGIAVGLALAVLLAVAPAQAQSPEDAAQKSVEPWLALVDSAHYAASWEQASGGFKRAVAAPQWEQAVTRAREPFGRLLSRKITSRTYSTTLPGAPDGQYVRLVFDSAFERKAAAVETAVMAREPDGAWRVAGYFIR